MSLGTLKVSNLTINNKLNVNGDTTIKNVDMSSNNIVNTDACISNRIVETSLDNTICVNNNLVCKKSPISPKFSGPLSLLTMNKDVKLKGTLSVLGSIMGLPAVNGLKMEIFTTSNVSSSGPGQTSFVWNKPIGVSTLLVTVVGGGGSGGAGGNPATLTDNQGGGGGGSGYISSNIPLDISSTTSINIDVANRSLGAYRTVAAGSITGPIDGFTSKITLNPSGYVVSAGGSEWGFGSVNQREMNGVWAQPGGKGGIGLYGGGSGGFNDIPAKKDEFAFRGFNTAFASGSGNGGTGALGDGFNLGGGGGGGPGAGNGGRTDDLFGAQRGIDGTGGGGGGGKIGDGLDSNGADGGSGSVVLIYI